MQIFNPEAALLADAGQTKILRMVRNERMAGSVPRWEKPSSGQSQTVDVTFAQRLNGVSAPESVLAYQGPDTAQPLGAEKPFGFGDLLDMVNPLQHIPVVSHFYRQFTGDTIRPISQIIGGAAFGGPFGAAGGLVNAVIQHETGKDMTGNAMAFVFEGKTPHIKTRTQTPDIQFAKAKTSETDQSADSETVNWKTESIITAQAAPSQNNIAPKASESFALEKTKSPYPLAPRSVKPTADPPPMSRPIPSDIAAQLLALTDLKSDENLQIMRLTQTDDQDHHS